MTGTPLDVVEVELVDVTLWLDGVEPVLPADEGSPLPPLGMAAAVESPLKLSARAPSTRLTSELHMNSFGFILDSLLRSLVAFFSQLGVFVRMCWMSRYPSDPTLGRPGGRRRRKDFMRWESLRFLRRRVWRTWVSDSRFFE